MTKQQTKTDFWKASPGLQEICHSCFKSYFEYWIKPFIKQAQQTQNQQTKYSISKRALPSNLDQYLLFLASLLLPLCEDGNSIPITKHHIINYLKWPATDADVVLNLIYSSFKFSVAVKNFKEKNEFDQLKIGKKTNIR
jgi:hypothetical protein